MTTSVLVTGGTGTLGQPVAQRLRDAGADVTVLSRHPREAAEGIRNAMGDLSTGEGIEAAVHGAEIIVHCAGSSKGDKQKTRTLVRAAKDARHIVRGRQEAAAGPGAYSGPGRQGGPGRGEPGSGSRCRQAYVGGIPRRPDLVAIWRPFGSAADRRRSGYGGQEAWDQRRC